MKNHTRKLCFILFALALAITSRAANVNVYDSIVSLATNATKNYTFTDPASGQNTTIAVTMSAYDPNNGFATFSAIDSDTHVGVDGNVIENGAGANFSASLVSVGSGVTTGSVKFGISGIGIRPVQGGGSMTWTSSVAGLEISYNASTEIVQSLDTTLSSMSGPAYSAQMRFPGTAYFQLSDVALPGASLVLNVSFTVTNNFDPRTNSWFTTYSGQYSRIYTNDMSRTNGYALTTWTNGSYVQALPVYCGVQEVYSSSNWVYVRSTGLGSHVMGPWYFNANHTQLFNSYPTNQKTMFRIPRTNAVPTKKVLSGGGAIGIFADGVAMYNNWDANFWNGTADVSEGGTNGFWNRDAYVNEGASFDPANAHQPQSGQYHYHANPPALRYLLGDHVDFNTTTKIYTESTDTPANHSPILGWAADGFPIYGPYGYSVSNNASSGIRRMVSGFVPRNGLYGTDNYSTTGALRKYIPQWASRLYGVPTNILAGPTVSSSYPFGRYMEDNDYLGDHGYAQGVTNADGTYFDLDEYNGRWCITPDFPNGTYAYFVAINSNGTPVYPYNIGFGYYGNPGGGTVTTIAEPVVTIFLGNTNLATTINSPTYSSGTITLSWSAIEGGGYQVEANTNLTDSSWTILQSGLLPKKINGGYTNSNVSSVQRFYRVGRSSVANFDSAGTTTFSTSSVAPGGSTSRGSTVTVTITLPSSPPNPPANAPITSVVLAGNINGTNVSDSTQGTVVATFTIPSNASTGAQNIVVTFQSPGPTYTLASGFTIN